MSFNGNDTYGFDTFTNGNTSDLGLLLTLILYLQLMVIKNMLEIWIVLNKLLEK